MGNATWVCFDCRESVRRPTEHARAVPCPQCGRDCRCLGTKIRIPSKGDVRAWQDLRDGTLAARLANAERLGRMKARRRHQLERRIADLEAHPINERRTRMLHRLREELASL